MSPIVILALDYFGIAVFAISGALAAGRNKLDIFGVIVVALVACLGGGTLRDLILNAHPVIWIGNSMYLLVGIGAALVTFILARLIQMPVRLLEICDGIGLAFFTIAGMQKTLSLGHDPEIALLMGVMTGVAGGILRDVLCNEIPLIFHKEIYATAALLGGGLFLGLQVAGLEADLAAVVGMVSILILRLAAVITGLSLPAFLFSENKPD